MDRFHRVIAGACSLAILFLAGCNQARTHAPQTASLPAKHSIKSNNLLVLSEFQIPRDHPLLANLDELRGTVATTLDLPAQRDDVVVYLFEDQERYQRYLEATYPTLPQRRAYFVGTSYEQAVYTYWGSRVGEDLRHEYTHGLLHSSLADVPLWLDEGLAEYFEVAGATGTLHSDYATRLTAALANGWRPDIKRLESLSEFSQMQRIDYQEAWVWVHYMLHNSPDTREILITYVHDLRTDKHPRLLSERLSEMHPQLENRFIAYLANLQTANVLARTDDENN